MHAIELQNVTKTFDEHNAVDDLTFIVPQGCVYGFIGPNGSGKTTTLRMIMNILYPDSGDIRVLGEHWYGSATDKIGYMPEERGLYKRMKVRELLVFLGGLKNTPQVSKVVNDWLDRLQLSEWADKKIETLSKGMTQKVQFIATVVSQPQLVLLDEPFSGLDPVNTEAIKDAILELQQKGTTIIFSTHDMNMAEKMCDFILMIYKGRKVLDGTLNSIKEKYGNDTIRVSAELGAESLSGLTGVERVNDFGNVQELRISGDTDPHQVLLEILNRTHIHSYEIVQPSLHDIFIRIAGGNGQEVSHE